jgi:UPF0716 protein FxsA
LLKRIALILVLLPAAEVVAFLLVAWAIGFLPALGLMILTSIAGAVVLSRAGRGQIARLGGTVRARGIAGVAAEPGGIMFAFGGILMLLPGFITDFIGAGLLIGPIRRRVGAAIGRAARVPRGATGAPAVIDLAPGEWRSLPDQEQPKARPKARPTTKRR